MRWIKAVCGLVMPFVLTSCYLAPGKFTSALTINADRTFAFSYTGEVIDADTTKALADLSTSLAAMNTPAECTSAADKTARCTAAKARAMANAKAAQVQKMAEQDNKYRAVAAALTKEAGYRSATYIGNGKFMIDYAIKGKLDHSFLFPFNADAELVLPFIFVEVRNSGAVRIKAPGFSANQSAMAPSDMPGMSGGNGTNNNIDGTFTLDTNAPVINQNSDDAPKVDQGRTSIVWRATPLTKDAPMAMLQLNP